MKISLELEEEIFLVVNCNRSCIPLSKVFSKRGNIRGSLAPQAGLENWAERNLIKFNKEIYEFLHLGLNNPRHKYMQGANWLESSSTKNFGNSM